MRRTLSEMSFDHNERGAVLAVSLILMTIMTLLASSALRTATLQLVTANNAQLQEKAFQLSQAGIAAAINRLNHGKLRLVAAGGWARPGAITGRDDQTGDTYVVDLRFLYRGPAPVRVQAEPQDALFFELESSGQTGSRNARSIQTQGLWVADINARPVNITYWFPHEAP